MKSEPRQTLAELGVLEGALDALQHVGQHAVVLERDIVLPEGAPTLANFVRLFTESAFVEPLIEALAQPLYTRFFGIDDPAFRDALVFIAGRDDLPPGPGANDNGSGTTRRIS